MSRGRPIRIVDSERSAGTSLANTIQNMLLDKTVKLLDKNEKTVLHRISLNQKLVLKRHQHKVHESQMNHARIVGDKALEAQLRRKYKDNSACMDDMEEADETLIKLWRQGQEDYRELRRRLGETGEKIQPHRARNAFVDLSSKTCDDEDVTEHPERPPIKRSVTSMSLVRPTKRPSTSMSVNLPFRRSVTGISLSNVPNIRSSTSMSMSDQSRRNQGNMFILQKDQQSCSKRPITAAIGSSGNVLLSKRKESQVRVETPDLNSTMTIVPLNNGNSGLNGTTNKLNRLDSRVSSIQLTPRPQTSLGHSTVKVVIKTNKSQGQGHSEGNGARSRMFHRKSTLPGFFDDEQEEKPSLLQVHKERVQSANYLSKIDTFVDDLKEWKADEKDIIQDYYYVGQVENNRLNSAGATDGERRSSMKPTEIRKHTGDLQVRNLTFPKLDM